jgi:hypothetical protein
MTYRWYDQDQTLIVGPDGFKFPPEPGNRFYDKMVLDGSSVDAYQQPSPTRGDVNEERERRIRAGQTVTLSNGTTLTAQTRDEADFRNLNGLVSKAIIYTMMQNTEAVMTFCDADNVRHELTPDLVIELGSLVGARVDNLYKKSWAIKDDPKGIATNYKDESLWE